MHHSRYKDFDMNYHFIKDMVDKKAVELHHCKSEDNVADLFTKGVAKS